MVVNFQIKTELGQFIMSYVCFHFVVKLWYKLYGKFSKMIHITFVGNSFLTKYDFRRLWSVTVNNRGLPKCTA